MTNSEKLQPTSSACAACKERIVAGASICKHCGAHQNWWRHVSISTNVLALIVALISVTTVFISTIKSSTARSDIRVIVNREPTLDFDRTIEGSAGLSELIGHYVFVVRPILMNSGNKSGAVVEGSVEIDLDGHALTGTLEFPPSHASLAAGDYRVVELRIPLDTSRHEGLIVDFGREVEEPYSVIPLKVDAATLNFTIISNSGETRVQEFVLGAFETTIDVSKSSFRPSFH